MFDFQLNMMFNTPHALTDPPGDLEMAADKPKHTEKSRNRDELDHFTRGM
jgi:hypothetical protein